MTPMTKSRPVLLVGSVPLGSAAEVFESAGTALSELLRGIPDGETGTRLGWIGCQAAAFRDATGLEPSGTRTVPGVPQPFILYGIKPGTRPEEVNFGPLGYAAWAI